MQKGCEGLTMKRVASIQDISCLGRCSLTVALPVLSVMGVECAVIPTAVLSTHTIFPDFTCRDLTDELLPIARHWKSQQVHLDAIASGYLASPRQTEAVCRVFDMLRGADTLIVVDPAMADHGRLYKPFAPDFPQYMKKVCTRADVLLPNLTEACLLTDTPYREDPDEAFVQVLLQKLSHLAPRVVLTGVSLRPGAIGAGCFLVEIQEPTDYTIRVERTTPSGFAVADSMCHQGLGFEKMFECFHYEPHSREEIHDRWFIEPETVLKTAGGSITTLVGYRNTPLFRLDEVNVSDTLTVDCPPRGSGIYVLEGAGTLSANGRSLPLKKTDQLFVPAGTGRFTLDAEAPLRVLHFFGPEQKQ